MSSAAPTAAASHGTRTNVYWAYGVFGSVETDVALDGGGVALNVLFRPWHGAELSAGIDLFRMRLVGTVSAWVADLPGR